MAAWSIYGVPSMPKAKSLTLLSRAKFHQLRRFRHIIDSDEVSARTGVICCRKLNYRGRLDEGRKTPPRAEAPRELVEAMRAIASTGAAPADQQPSIGCSIKWKDT
jgi:hypothetical protein